MIHSLKKNLKICCGLLSILSISTYAAPSLIQDKIAVDCRPYLLTYASKDSMPADVGIKAAPKLSQCIAENSCENDNLSDISNCALKLANINMMAQLAGMNSSDIPELKGSKSPANQSSVQTMKNNAPESTSISPAPIDQQEKNTSEEKKKNSSRPQKKQPSINWF